MPILNSRMTARIEGDFVVFLIGMRINRPLKIHKWLPVAMAMPRMLKELSGKPESGFLGFEFFGGLSPAVLQYWRSFEHLDAYAKDRNGEHYPAWKAFNQKIRTNGDVGIWHETYQVQAGAYENVYVNMPSFGLGKAGTLQEATEKHASARQRIQPDKS
jgi:hypothetical protein